MAGFFGGRPKNSEESDREFSKNFEVKREFLPNGDVPVQRFLWKIFDDVNYVMDEISKLLGNEENEREEMWLHLVEESLFLIGPSDPQREQILFQFFRWLYVPKRKTTLKRLGDRLNQLVYEIDVGMEVKYNVLLILLILGDLAFKWKESLNLPQPVGSNYSTEDDIERDMVPLHQYVFNNGMVNLIWMLANSSHIYTKILALSVLHKYIENLESPFPPPIEEVFEAHVRRALANNKNPELQFLAYYIAKHTFGEQINIRTEDLEEERLRKDKIAGKGKIYIQPHDGIMLDSNGLTVRNNTNKLQVAHVHRNLSVALSQGKWYWEITVCSTRFTKIGYSVKGDDVIGQTLDIKRADETFGFALYSDERVFRIFSSSGEDSNPKVEACTSFLPCVALGPLQQVVFNFGEPLLKNHPAVRDLFQKKDKTSPLFDLFSTVKCTLPPFEYTPPNTYRQQITLPMKKGKNVRVEKRVSEKEDVEKEKNKKTSTSEKESTSPQRSSSTSGSLSPWIPKKKEVLPLIPLREDEIEEKDPDEFCCPISRSIMIDPVIASDGRTYERSDIEQWLKDNNTSPITREKMVNTDLEPNIKLKGDIEKWLKKKDNPIVSPKPSVNKSKNKKPKGLQSPDRSHSGRQRRSEMLQSSGQSDSEITPIKGSSSVRNPKSGQIKNISLSDGQSDSEITPTRGSSTVRHSKSGQMDEGQSDSDMTSIRGSSTVRHSQSEIPQARQKKSTKSPVKQRSQKKVLPKLSEEKSPARQRKVEEDTEDKLPQSPVRQRKVEEDTEDKLPQSPVRQRKVEEDTEDKLPEIERRMKLQQHMMDEDEDEEYAVITDD